MKTLKFLSLAVIATIGLVSCDKEENNQSEDEAIKTKNAISSGEGGSMAQFTIIDDYLYTVDYKSLNVFHIVNPDQPTLLEKIDLGIGIETIFPQNDHLFIGTQNGVKIYDVTNPRSPEEVSEFEHVTSCDPVIANDDYALATLRGGTACGGNLSLLSILDISNLENPIEISTTTLINPYGLGFLSSNENLAFICDGYDGLKLVDFTDPLVPQILVTYPQFEAIDVIEEDNQLILLTRQGVYQFDASNPAELTELSFIPVM